MTSATPHTSPKLLTPPFVVAVVMLGSAAILAGPVGRWLEVRLEKLPLPLKKPLAALDVDAIAPYKLVDRRTLEPNVVEALGTSQFLHWTLEDPTVPASDPLHRATLFITYYSGGRDPVPHVPDECMLGAGYQPAQAHENRDIPIDTMREVTDSIPIRVCTFIRTAIHNRSQSTVIYTFATNDTFAATRNSVRAVTSSPRNKYAYFSKIEVSFPGASRELSIEGARKLFSVVLPVLRRDHLPDFKDAEANQEKETS